MRTPLPSAADLLIDGSKSFTVITLGDLAKKNEQKNSQSIFTKDKELLHLKMVELLNKTKSNFLKEHKNEYLKENKTLDGFNPDSYNLDGIEALKEIQSTIDANKKLNEDEFRKKYSPAVAIDLLTQLDMAIQQIEETEKSSELSVPSWEENKKKLVAKLIEKTKAVKSSLICDFKITYLQSNDSLTGFNSGSIDFDSLEPIKNLKTEIASNNSMDSDAFNSKYPNITNQFAILDEEIKNINKEALRKIKIQEEISERIEKTKREAEKKLQKEIAEKLKVAEEVKKILDNIILKGLKLIEETAKNKAELEKAQLEAEEKAKKEVEEKARTEAKKLKKEVRTNEFNKQQALNSAQGEAVTEILTEITSEFLIQAIKNALDEFKVEEEAKRKLEEKAKIEAEAQAKQQIEEIKDKILAKTSANFEKFQSFFDHLRDIKWLEIGEIGLFGSRVYREVISETCPALEIPKNPQADFDFFCIPRGVDSSGIFKLCHQESASRDNFREVIEDFNKKNPNLQIYFKDEEIPYALDEIVKKDGERSVNFLANQSLNFKLVAVILEDKKTSEDETGEEKTEKIVKEKIEFDLNFYKQQSMLENLQWQFNLERVLLAQNPDQTFTLKINHCNCDPSQEKMTVEDFFAKALGEEMREFLFESNPQARGFLNRMINKKGIYKYLDEATLNALKSGLLEDEYIKENLEKELLLYKKIVDDIASKSPESEMVDEKFKQAKFILDTIEKDEIFKENKDFQEILRTIPRVTPAGANVARYSPINR